MRRPFAFPLLAMLAAACSGDGDGTDQLVVRREGAPLFSAPAVITWCAADSMLAAVAIGEAWLGALAVRTPFPLEVADTFPILAQGDGPGVARLALRARGETAQPAWNADSGQVLVERGAELRLRFEARAVQDPQDTMRVQGELSGTAQERCA